MKDWKFWATVVLVLVGMWLFKVAGAAHPHPGVEPDLRDIRVHKLRGPHGYCTPGLYHLPDFGVCFMRHNLCGHEGPYAVPVPCPWEKK